MKIILASPRGFCAGVDRAIHIVEKALVKYGSPIYVRHEIVHNKFVVERLKEQGAVFVEELDEVPADSTVIFSAHGVAERVYQDASARNFRVIDASCPLVKRVHFSAKRQNKDGARVILIGHAGHPEVVGTLGQLPEGHMILVRSVEDVNALELPRNEALAYITQTTLSIDDTRNVIAALKEKFSNIRGPERGDLCYATTNRQEAVKQLAKQADLLLVVGAFNSSNSNRLKELGSSLGVIAHLIRGDSDLHTNWFKKGQTIGISSGASTPDDLVDGVIDKICSMRKVSSIEQLVTLEENVNFSLPVELR